MKPKTMMLMVVAVGCGLVASYMTSRLLAERNAQPQAEPKVTVVVAKQKVSPMVLIKEPEKFFELREFPESVAPKKGLKSLDELKDQRLSKPLAEDSPVTADDVLNKEQMGLPAKLPPGTHAVAIKVNAESLVGGFVLPGSHVDVISTTRGGEAQSQIILQDMLVLAVDTNYVRDANQQTILGSTVTLAAKPEEATKLALAGALGELKLTLRGLGDTGHHRVPAVKGPDLAKALHGGSGEADDRDAQGPLANPPVPKDLPTPPPPPPKVEEKKEEPREEPPVKTHKMTIISGEYTQTAVFVLDPVEGWKNGTVNRDEAAAPPPAGPNRPGRNR
jgi:pilus assembly protein CpaB